MLDKKRSTAVYGKCYQNHNYSNIPKETRQESYILRPVTRVNDIVRVLGDDELTAREIAQRLGFNDRGYVAPRLTEMKAKGLVEVTGKRFDHISARNVAVWRLKNVE